MLTIATPHPVTHSIVGADPYNTVMLEYLFHFTMTAAVAILAYFQHRFLVMAISGIFFFFYRPDFILFLF